ncbi:FecR domain-containing protein [Pseudomonas sp. JH-2]|uniref:FecR family protein n=1 Tax=Pseudomonas sp. JH-2 TaxID=3114998 RepID=UPI002E272F9B|nr:FecR domain-containing protein [Pseudomonas sp. JH-2]
MDNETWRRGRKRPTMAPSYPMDEQDCVSETDERHPPRDDDPAWQQAMDWLMRLREAPDSMELRRACRAWAEADPRHARALRQLGRAWQLSGMPAESASAQALAPHAAPVAPRPQPRRRKRWPQALAASLLLGMLAWTLQPEDPNRFSASTNRELRLPDGSQVSLAAGSRLELAFSGNQRQVRLVQGEAFFDVAHDSARPFSVEAGGGTVVVTGTAFDVRAEGQAWEVAVARGSVRVQPPRGLPPRQLGPGDRLRVEVPDGQVRQEKVPAGQIGAWRQGQLLANDTPLLDLLEQLRRNYPGVLLVDEQAFAGKRVTGIYDLRDPRRALQAMVRPFGGEVGGWGPLWLSVHPGK